MSLDPERVDGATPRVESATFEPRPLHVGRFRAAIVTGAWILVVVALVAIGGLGRSFGGPATVRVVPSIAVAAAPPANDEAPAAMIQLESPAVGPIVISRPQLTVAGGIATHLDHVVIALESADNGLVADATVDVSDPNGGVRPLVAPTFEATLALPNPRPSGTMWVVVTAYDNMGMPVDVVRRAVVISAVSDARPRRFPA